VMAGVVGMKTLGLMVGALALWFLAVVGAIALAVWLRLSAPETRRLVIAVACIAFLGVSLPIIRLRKT